MPDMSVVGPLLPLDKAPERPRWCPHCGGELDKSSTIHWGGWSFNETKHQFEPGTPGANIHFTNSEGNMISTILRAHGQVVGKEGGLYSAVCANRPETDWPDMKIVDVIICKIRRKLREKNLLMTGTSWGRGYFAVPYDPNPVFVDLATKQTITQEQDAANSTHFARRNCRCKHARTNHSYKGQNGVGGCMVIGCDCTMYQYPAGILK